LNKNDINITVDERVLTIEAERREEKKLRSPTTSNQSSSIQTANNQSNQSMNSSTSNTSTSSPPSSTPSTTAGTGSGTSGTPGTSGTAGPSSKEEKYPDADEMKVSTTDQQKSMMTDDNDVSYHHMESFYGRVSRRVQLPEDARVEELTAKYEDGIIKIDIPRSQQEPKPRGRKIELQ